MKSSEKTPLFNLNTWSVDQLARVEQALSRWVVCPEDAPALAGLGHAMRYAVLDGGKRLRPLLVMAACEAVAGSANAALRAACAVELIHAYSLVHDDLPCMDNDVLRRGKPTVHVAFGQASALLAGDALQALAFELLTPALDTTDAAIDSATQAHLCRMLAQAAGFKGMAGGQAIDLASVGKQLNSSELHEMHALKTGALLKASVMMGAACSQSGPATSIAVQDALRNYGDAIGLAFQVVDDILDVTADSAVLGKTAGKDAAQDKPTFVSLMGLQASQDYAQQLLQRTLHSLAQLEAAGLPNTHALRGLADMLVNRQH
ncbi:Farnesyl diphosphate synthase [Polaromonas vacuolata]|uniref:Farnesyl diphosphate synthase n=1 Tax=Polaromonas vacuolata TaxID=37448 RepID=A0A6H2H7G4_9BURK|nr:farnesyl diphosphate synthase [Polaromonas vacuolata]QJC55733.1 Farnesyl diphosphate synthase [Polaromonas vacuolata]